MSKRIAWIDYVKVIACCLVVLGHFFQSMSKDIISKPYAFTCFVTLIYYFHVPLFFICSGYLYQKFSVVRNRKQWCNVVSKKLFALGVPYLFFSTATWLLKNIFSNSVNNKIVGGIADAILLHPISPYWYLYCLFFVFAVTPTIKNKNGILFLTLALCMKLFILCFQSGIFVVDKVFSNEMWFVFGMCISVYDLDIAAERLPKCQIGIVGMILFSLIGLYYINLKIDIPIIPFVLGVIACVSVILIVIENAKLIERFSIINYLSKYTLPIFLMHTIFAAPVRIALLKIRVDNFAIHAILGIAASFICPIIVQKIFDKTKYLSFTVYPNKFIKL